VPLSNLCVAGVCHADDIGYLFHIGMLDLDIDPASPEFKTLSRMVKLWTNFAKTG
jgi:carboxylesterase type B